MLDPVRSSENPVSRRTVIAAGVLAVGVTELAACSQSAPTSAPLTGSSSRTGPSGSASASVTSPPAATTRPASGTTTPAPVVLSTPGPDIRTGPTSMASVALTFHGAGDVSLTSAALAIAREAGAYLTVFAVGQWLAANPQTGRDLVAAGHDLGNHTWSHQPMTALDAAAAGREVEQGANAVAATVGRAGLLFRPSGTPTSTPTIRAAALAAGYPRCISYDVDPLDYTDPGSSAVQSRTLAAVQPGSIVSLHLGHQGTVDALPGILQGLADKGLAAVTVTRLLTGLA